jgi:hypothetical protein
LEDSAGMTTKRSSNLLESSESGVMNSRILANDEISGSIEPSGYLQSSVIDNRVNDKKDRSSEEGNSAERMFGMKLPSLKKRDSGSPENDSKATKKITFDETAKDTLDKLRSGSKGMKTSKSGRQMFPPANFSKFTQKTQLKPKLAGIPINTTIAVIKNRPDPVKDEFLATKNQFSDFESQTKSNLTGTQFRLSNPGEPAHTKPKSLTPRPQKFVHNIKMSKLNLLRKLKLNFQKTDPAQLSIFTNPNLYTPQTILPKDPTSRRVRNFDTSQANGSQPDELINNTVANELPQKITENLEIQG